MLLIFLDMDFVRFWIFFSLLLSVLMYIIRNYIFSSTVSGARQPPCDNVETSS